MKIVLVQGKYFNSWECLAFGYIGAYIKKHIPKAILSFYQGAIDSETEIITDCLNADFVCFSATSPSYEYCKLLCKKIKEINKNVITVIGGYHVSALPHESLVEGIVDKIIVGEGEDAMVKIINRVDDNDIVYGRRMKFEELFWPDRDLIKNYRNIEVAFKGTGKRITSFQSHRSCPFMCKYCADGHESVLYFGQKVKTRSRDVNDLLSEMIFYTGEYSLDLLKFCDATWNIDKNYVKSFCQSKINRNFTTPFFANIHANICDDEMFNLMRQSGCEEIGLGIESGSEKILKQIGKGTTKNSIRNAVYLAKKNNIKVRGYFILGMPEETRDDIILTEQFAEELDIDEYGFTILCPYPGTQMYALEPSRFKNIKWEETDEYSNTFWKTNYIDNETLRNLQLQLVDKFKNKLTWHNKTVHKGTI